MRPENNIYYLCGQQLLYFEEIEHFIKFQWVTDVDVFVRLFLPSQNKYHSFSLNCTLMFGWSGSGEVSNQFLLFSLNISIPSEEITSEGASLVLGILIREKLFPFVSRLFRVCLTRETRDHRHHSRLLMMNQRLGWAAGSSLPDMLLSKLRLIQSCNKIYLKLARAQFFISWAELLREWK